MNREKKTMAVIMGSPHLNGNVATACKAIIDGAKSSGVEVMRFDLARMNIKNCLGCRKCVENGGHCVLKDDMNEVFQAILASDIVVIASPIYICQVNGITKTFLDRLYPLTDEKHVPRYETRKLIMLYTYGAPVPFLFHHYRRQTGKDLKSMGLKFSKMITISGCTTQSHVMQNNKKILKLRKFGEKLGSNKL